jgi:hypothetical protein
MNFRHIVGTLVAFSLCSAAPALALTGCAATHGSPGGAGAPSEDCTSIPKVQGLAQACCPAWGVDACGPGLFCAAFDGRTVDACYVVGSRKAGETCTADEQCESTSCNVAAGVCHAATGAPCTESAGCAGDQVCAADPQCHQSACSSLTCQPVEQGLVCATDTDCNSADGFVCDTDHLCGWSDGHPCIPGYERCVTGDVCCPSTGVCTPSSACGG